MRLLATGFLYEAIGCWLLDYGYWFLVVSINGLAQGKLITKN